MGSRILASRYEILERIGDGGMAVVFKARCRLLNRNVAIKILKPEYINDAKFIDSFRRESQAAASLSHPNIVNVYDVGKEGNIYYIVMELLEGDSLSEIIKREAPMDPKRVVAISKQIASALSHAHKHNIIHRDVKPHNIMLTSDGTAKITDFGIAKAVNSGTIVNGAKTVMGSVHYLSPEQARGGYVDDKSDIYSLGIVMYEMLTGKVPFDAENAVAVAMMHINNEVPAPSLAESGVPAGLDDVVVKATSRFQNNRYNSAQDMYNALVTAGFEISAGRSSLESANDRKAVESRATVVIPSVGRSREEVKPPASDNSVSQFAAGPAGSAPSRSEEIVQDQEEPAAAEDVKAGKERGGILKKKDKPPKEKSAKKKAGKSGDRQMSRGKSVLIKVAAIVLALVCSVPASIWAIGMMNGSKTIDIPDMRGKTLDEAIEVLASYGLEYKLGNDIYSDVYAIGQIADQKPEAGEAVKEGYKITLSVSRGPEGQSAIGQPVSVPPLVGYSINDAKSILKSVGLLADVDYIASELPKDVVISQDPETGSSIYQNSTVRLIVSKGTEEVTVDMPGLIGKDIDTARALLENAGIGIASISTAYSDTFAENQVMEQQYQEGSKLKQGASVTLKVSLGPDITANIDVPMNIVYDSAANDIFYLTVTVSDSSGLRKVIDYEQRIRSNGGETIMLTGSGSGSVRVIFDDDIVAEYSVDFTTGRLS